MRRVRIEQDAMGALRAVDAATREPIAGVWRIEIIASAEQGRARVSLCLDMDEVDLAFATTAEIFVHPIPRPASMYGRSK